MKAQRDITAEWQAHSDAHWEGSNYASRALALQSHDSSDLLFVKVWSAR